MVRQPVTLVQPQILHQDDRHTVWHAGVVLGPTDAAVLYLQVDSPEERRFRDDPAWKGGGPPPIDAYIELGQPGRMATGSFSFGADRFAFRFEHRFQPLTAADLPAAELHIKVHPLSLYVIMSLDPEHPQVRKVDAGPGRSPRGPVAYYRASRPSP